MSNASPEEKLDLNVLLWIAGSRKGASFAEIVEHECAHHRRHAPTQDELRASLERLVARQLITRTGDHFDPQPELRQAFLEECRNCRDTFEEHSVLQRIVAARVK